MRQSDVVEWLHDEIESFLSNSTLVSPSTPAEHVGLAEKRDERTYPFVGIQKIASTSETGGIGSGEIRVDEVTYDSNGVVQSITYRRDVTLRVEVLPTTDGDRHLRDNLLDDLADHFTVLARNGDVPEDIEPPSVEEATPQGRPDDFVYTDGLPMEIEYARYHTDDSVTAAEEVNVDVDAGDGDGNTANSFDETFN